MEIMIPFSILTLIIYDCVGTSPRINWTPQLNEKLLEIYSTTEPLKKDHRNRMRDKWSENFPDFANISSKYLRERAVNLLSERGEHRQMQQFSQRTNLSLEQQHHLLEIYHKVQNESRNHPMKMYNEWVKKYPELSSMSPINLYKRALHLAGKFEKDGKIESGNKITWTNENVNDLLRIYQKYPSNCKDQATKLKQEWMEKHPEYETATSHHLQAQARKFMKQRAHNDSRLWRRRFDWTRQQKADLLHIYHRTNPKIRHHGRRIYERWTKMYPGYDSSRHDLLKKRASSLISHHYQPTEEEEKAARIKFDRLSPPKSGTLEGQEIPDPEDMEATSPERHDRHELFLHDFMSADNHHEELAHNYDRNVLDEHMANSGLTLFPHLAEESYNINYDHNENANSSFHQETNSNEASPSKYPVGKFHKFL